MSERKAVYYGKVELIPGVICDGYVLDDDMAVMSLRGAADLLHMDHKALERMGTKPAPKSLKPFIDKGFSMGTNSVKVVAENSPYKGRKIVIYTSETIEALISSYALAFAHEALRPNQKHIGKRCVILLKALVRAALDIAIRQACGLSADIQKTAQQHYIDVAGLLGEFGFVCSVSGDIATKKDIARFLEIPESTLNSFLRKHKSEIRPVLLEKSAIRSLGSSASRMNGYRIDDVGKIALSMDSVVGIGLKKQVFGQVGSFAKPDTRDEIQWRKVLAEIFDGFDLRYNYPIGKYKADFFVAKLMLVLECNGYCHLYYDPAEEAKREKFIGRRYGMVRFDHNVSLETLFNGILQAKPGTVVRLYGFGNTGKRRSPDCLSA